MLALGRRELDLDAGHDSFQADRSPNAEPAAGCEGPRVADPGYGLPAVIKA